MQRSAVGVGPALRKVREQHGLTLEESARDTRVRREFLEALENEEFDRLLGDVHVRGCLRTYATYLRLSPDKVVAAYAASVGQDEAPEPASVSAQPEPVLGARRRRDNHRLLALIATVVLVLAAAFGILSARDPAPAPAELSAETSPAASASLNRPITVAVTARQPVDVTIAADGGDGRTFAFEAGEGRSFEADTSLFVQLSIGGSARIVVNGRDEGFPGDPDGPWHETYSYDEPSGPSG